MLTELCIGWQARAGTLLSLVPTSLLHTAVHRMRSAARDEQVVCDLLEVVAERNPLLDDAPGN